ncbi:hypothetical protein [Lacticaseibacillus paracasei]|uniref:hypothetical protein n=1 Tax=Lacticaseibacillus paracasei TaxID=1597 RepID=UPI00131F9D58|nr:hypothetical protein [Lacticaseibacillus paracasei]QHC81182.1 DUF1642 domain-containing protein [Lacticaseibacillus paracasei]
MTETKRYVVEAILLAKDTDTIWDSSNVRYYLNVYDNALPDDLPVIPKAVGEYLKTHRKDSLGEIFWKLGCKSSAFIDSNELYIVLNSETFARAWVLGVWRVEETGEIVKLEAEK